MPISTDLLDGNEDVLVERRPHWIFFAGPLLLTAACGAVVGFVLHQFPKAPVEVAWVLAALVGVPALWLAGRLARWRGTSLVVTDRRIVFRSGVLSRRVVNLRLQRVVDTHCSQGPLERLIGSGRLVLEVEGEEGALAVDDVRRPRALQRVINRQLTELDAPWERPAPPQRRAWTDPGSPSDSTPPRGVHVLSAPVPAGAAVPDQLVALDRLRRQGILSDEEFATKKAELLRRI